MVMGTVGFIEERGRLNLGLGIPAGAASVLAAGACCKAGSALDPPTEAYLPCLKLRDTPLLAGPIADAPLLHVVLWEGDQVGAPGR